MAGPCSAACSAGGGGGPSPPNFSIIPHPGRRSLQGKPDRGEGAYPNGDVGAQVSPECTLHGDGTVPSSCWGHHEACGDREGQALPAPLSQPQPGGQLPLRHSEHPHFPLPQRLPLLMEETFRCPTASGTVPFQGCCDTGMAWSSPVTARCQRWSGTGAGSEGCEPTLEPRQSLPSLLVS